MLFTSGTTGRPKAAMLTHRTILYQGAVVGAGRFLRDDCPYVVAPFVHVLALASLVAPLIHVGASFELAARFDPDTVLDGLAAGRLTHLYGAPPMFAALVSKDGHASGGDDPGPPAEADPDRRRAGGPRVAGGGGTRVRHAARHRLCRHRVLADRHDSAG